MWQEATVGVRLSILTDWDKASDVTFLYLVTLVPTIENQMKFQKSVLTGSAKTNKLPVGIKYEIHDHELNLPSAWILGF